MLKDNVHVFDTASFTAIIEANHCPLYRGQWANRFRNRSIYMYACVFHFICATLHRHTHLHDLNFCQLKASFSQLLSSLTSSSSSAAAVATALVKFIFTRHSCTGRYCCARISYGNSVCLSVRPSVTTRYRIKPR